MEELPSGRAHIVSVPVETDRRPRFVSVIHTQFYCPICGYVMQDPVITACGKRSCRDCILAKFAENAISIPCPFNHADDGIEPDDLQCRDGFSRQAIHDDPAALHKLLKERAYCPYLTFGCSEQPRWRRLEEHVNQCAFKPFMCTECHMVYEGQLKMETHKSITHFRASAPCYYSKYGCTAYLATAEEFESHRVSNTQQHLDLLPVTPVTRATVHKTNLAEAEIRRSRSLDNEELASHGKAGDGGTRDITKVRCSLVYGTSGSGYGFSGVMTWKIPEYSRMKQQAVSGRTVCFDSPPFYTADFGYKLCGRIYLNGERQAKGESLSLFFVLMSGEFDELLPWPFACKVTLSILSPVNQAYSVTLMPDRDSASFSKPPNNPDIATGGSAQVFTLDNICLSMNPASGCPNFMEQQEVEKKYVINDTLYVRIKVHVP